jgi:hypothetical protein
MKEFWVEIIRKETSFERCMVCVNADSAEEAKQRVREHYMAEGDGVLTYEEECTEQHQKHLGIDGSEIVEIGEVSEA